MVPERYISADNSKFACDILFLFYFMLEKNNNNEFFVVLINLFKNILWTYMGKTLVWRFKQVRLNRNPKRMLKMRR